MTPRRLGILAVLSLAAASALRAEPPAPGHFPRGLSPEDQALIRLDYGRLQRKIADLRRDAPVDNEQLADAEIYLKGVTWALDYDDSLTPADTALVKRALQRGLQRADSLARGRRPWAVKKGRVIRGYRSAVDGSVQGCGVMVPESYDPARPIRLDVVLHGSSKPVGMSDLRFLMPFDEGDEGGKPIADQDYLELRPVGRVENGYRWAGETDVFEAIDAVCRDYKIDRDRIVLRGMSMGASGTWHLGLKHPDQFVALGPYCGYVDTHQFSLSPIPNFVPVGPLPGHQEKTLHMLDSRDYAANAGVAPAIAAIGDRDPFFQAHVIMGRAMAREGLTMVNLISPGTGHVQDPVTWREQMRRIGEYAARGLDHAPRRLRFVTWTLKYSRCHWLEALGLKEHYVRSELDARLGDDGSISVRPPVNVTRFAVYAPALKSSTRLITVGGQQVRLPKPPGASAVLDLQKGKWVYAGRRERAHLSGKRPGIQGPIDDAFTAPFLCVRGTGTPWNPAVAAWANAALDRFAYEWRRYFRGDLPVKADVDVTDADIRGRNLILFGDPGSNRLIAKAAGRLPIRWTSTDLEMAGEHYVVAGHVPMLVAPDPLPGGRDHYLVLNSGHTFHEKELASLNYLLFPRLGDWAVARVDAGSAAEPAVVKAGLCQEDWSLPRKD